MSDVTPEYVEERLKELAGWAGYICESLALDGPHEAGKTKLLGSLISKEELDKIRFEARALRYRLRNLAANVRRLPVAAPR